MMTSPRCPISRVPSHIPKRFAVSAPTFAANSPFGPKTPPSVSAKCDRPNITTSSATGNVIISPGGCTSIRPTTAKISAKTPRRPSNKPPTISASKDNNDARPATTVGSARPLSFSNTLVMPSPNADNSAFERPATCMVIGSLTVIGSPTAIGSVFFATGFRKYCLAAHPSRFTFHHW
ncbi:MAG: hypothetical protein DDT36_01748 [Firmicutes bacterium]|nr:hypothetical protein [Bacillota bacterium]